MRSALALLYLIGIPCYAESRTITVQLVCDDRDTLFTNITETFKEIPQWMGKNLQDNTQSVLTVNLTSGAWTLIEFNQSTACVLAMGENSKSVMGTRVKTLYGNDHED